MLLAVAQTTENAKLEQILNAHVSRGWNAVHPISFDFSHRSMMRNVVTFQTRNFASRRRLSPEIRFARRNAAIARGGAQWSYFVGLFLGSDFGPHPKQSVTTASS